VNQCGRFRGIAWRGKERGGERGKMGRTERIPQDRKETDGTTAVRNKGVSHEKNSPWENGTRREIHSRVQLGEQVRLLKNRKVRVRKRRSEKTTKQKKPQQTRP